MDYRGQGAMWFPGPNGGIRLPDDLTKVINQGTNCAAPWFSPNPRENLATSTNMLMSPDAQCRLLQSVIRAEQMAREIATTTARTARGGNPLAVERAQQAKNILDRAEALRAALEASVAQSEADYLQALSGLQRSVTDASQNDTTR